MRRLNWNASTFRTITRNDLMFISSGPLTNTGHFQNVGDTTRYGLELDLSGAMDTVRWGVAYTFLRALFATPLTLSSPNHPGEENGEIDVEAGSRIPGVPQHNVKASISAALRRLTVGATLVANSSQYLRGDEANLLAPVDAFTVVNLLGSYAVTRRIALTGRVTNVFDTQYSTFGLLGEADEVLGDEFDDPRFVGPGAPRAAWVGISISFR
jgi:outer membrane receptor protein involved in Fe transport